LRKGLADMLITDVGAPVKKRCDGVLVEREHLDLIIAEQRLSQSHYADPSQRIPSGHLIGHNRVVSGTLTVTGATATLTVTVTTSLVLDQLGPAPAGSPAGEYAFFRPEAGTVRLTLDMVDGHCTGHGETDLGVDPGGGLSSVQQGVTEPTYTLYAAFAASPGI